MAENVMRVPSLSKIPSLGRVPSLNKNFSNSRSKHIQKTINNFKITVLCGLLTFVVLRSTVGAGKFGTPEQDYEKLRERLSGLRRAHRRALEEVIRKDTTRMLAVANEVVYSFDSRISGENAKSSILMVTARQPPHCMQRADSRIFLRSLKNKIDYCRLHQIEIFDSRVVELGAMGNFMSKVELLRAAILAHPEVEWIYWMESGVVVTDMEFEFPTARYKGYDAVIGGWNGEANEPRLGSLLLRNSGWALDFLAKWEARWRSGTATEGVVMAELLQEEKIFYESSHILQEDGKTADSTKIEDFRPLSDGDRRSFLTDFTGCNLCSVANNDGDADGNVHESRCLHLLQRALDIADLQFLSSHGFRLSPVTFRSASPPGSALT